MKISKNFKLSILTILISISITVIGAEYLTQVILLSKLKYWGEFVPDDNLAWMLRPNATFDVEWYPGIRQSITTNEHGLRDTKNVKDIKKDKRIIMLQGDSNILGYVFRRPQLIHYNWSFLYI